MSAAYLIGLGRNVDGEGGDGSGDAAGSSSGVSSSDGRSILVFARGLGAQPADLVRLYEVSAPPPAAVKNAHTFHDRPVSLLWLGWAHAVRGFRHGIRRLGYWLARILG
jgi:hypothetical protein